MLSGRGDSEPPPLDKRPIATQWAVEDLLRYVKEGRIRIPTFQRSWQWRREDVRKLFDSIHRGYPVGTLLLWKRREEEGTVTIGPHVFPVTARDDALSLVDGQQRLTALAGVLLPHVAADPPGEFDLYFDLDDEVFVHPGRQQRPRPSWIPMTEVVDAENLFAWLDEHRRSNPPKDHLQRAIRLGKVVREYQVPGYIVETDDEDVLRQVFTRVNKAGKPLKEEDIFDALHGGRRGAVPSDTRAIHRAIAALGLGTVHRRTILRAVQAIQRADMAREPEVEPSERAGAGPALARTERALRRTVAFLVEDARIPHLRLLPYEMPIVVLSKLFDRFNDVSSRSKQLLRRWVWRGAITEAHRGDIVGLRAALEALDTDDETSAVSGLLGLVGPRPKDENVLRTFNFRFARSKLDVLTLVSLEPRDFSTGEILHVRDLLDEQQPLSLPSFVDPADTGSAAHTTTVANRAFHRPFRPVDLSARAATDVLESHGIDTRAWRAFVDGDRGTFLSRRADRLARARETLLEARAEWAHTDRPSLRSLTVPDED